MAKAGVECPLEKRKSGPPRTVSTPQKRERKTLQKQKERAKKKAGTNPGFGGMDSNLKDDQVELKCDL